jgi:glycosyltransferase involved in cell wall biosynthesis
VVEANFSPTHFGSGRIKWLLLASHIGPDSAGGVARFTIETARALNAHPRVQLSIAVTSEGAQRFDFLRPSQIEVVRGWARHLKAPAELWGHRYSAGRYDVIHGPKHIVPRIDGSLSLLTIHDMLIVDRRFDYAPLKRTLLPRAYFRSIANADVLACVSEAARQRLHHCIGEDPRTVVAGEGVGSDLAGPGNVLPPDPVPSEPFALYVGDFSPRKNVNFLLDAWEEVRREAPNAQLILCGPRMRTRGSTVDDRLLSRQSLRSVVSLGQVDDQQLTWLYRHAAVVCVPSLIEGFGLPVAEALAAGAHVLASPDPALREISEGRAEHLAWRRDEWRAGLVRALTGKSEQHRPPADMARHSWDRSAERLVASVLPRL